MTPLPEMLSWVASHANKFRRPGYKPPNHLANAEVRWIATDGTKLHAVTLDAQGNVPKGLTLVTLKPVEPLEPLDPSRIEIYASNGDLLFTEQA